MNFPEKLLYTKDHEWISVAGEKSYIGISDYAQTHLGDIVYIELPELDMEAAAGDSIGVIESVKAVATIFCPVDGTIVEVNEELEESPELINQDPYENWIAVFEINNRDDLDSLMNAQVYAEYCKSQAENEG